MEKNAITAIILTHNEERHIGRALDSLLPITNDIFIIDSFSSDSTCDVALRRGAKVLKNPFVNQAKQFQWALDNAPIQGNWIIRLDADEIIEASLADEIIKKLPTLSYDVVGINLKRKHIFMGRWVKYGGRYPLIMLRIWRRGHGHIEDRWMDEHISVSNGRTVTFNGGFADHNLQDLTFFTEKHNKYATREAIEILNSRLNLFKKNHELTPEGSSFQASSKRFIKDKIYNNIPFTLSATLYFLWRYTFQLGFLDGRSGLIYHFLQGYWYRFLVGSKVLELERGIAHLTDKQAIINELSALTGYNLNLPATEKPTNEHSF